MKRHVIPKRENWEQHAVDHGFEFHTMYGAPYWNEGVYYSFTLDEVEKKIEDPSEELHQMCLEAVELATKDSEVMRLLGIPEPFWDYIANNWKDHRNDDLYGRFDFAYDGELNPVAKLLEYNADTPTSLWEAGVYQWAWLVDAVDQDLLPRRSDQFNSIHEALIKTLGDKFSGRHPMYFSSAKGNQEDYATVEYLGYCAADAGITPLHLYLQDISISHGGEFCTPDGDPIRTLFLLYPWEDMLLDEFGPFLLRSKMTRFIEPAWKSILSNKGLLPLLWQLFPNHPNLLPAFFSENGPPDYSKMPQGSVTKPIYSREGSSIIIRDAKGDIIEGSEDATYAHHKMVIQGYAPIKRFDGEVPIIGSWIVDGKPVGMGIREDASRITQDLSKFTPHVIWD